MAKQKVPVNFWIDQQAQDAANYYTSIFQNSKINRVSQDGTEEFVIHQMPEGLMMSADFELEGQRFLCLNGGPAYKFKENISVVVGCESQDEIDYFWYSLSEGGDQEAQQCGWLKDKFGVPWYIVPYALHEIMSDTDVKKTTPVMREMLKMRKIELAVLQRAYAGAA